MLLLLIGYRYSIDSTANDWYLFQVARHTTAALGLVGSKAALEEERAPQNPAMVRDRLREWRGDTAAGVSPNTPLTPWERYQYRIENNRRRNSTAPAGPRVSFVLRPGLLQEIQALEQQAAALGSAHPTAENQKRLEQVQNTLTALRAKQAALPQGAEGRAALLGKSFTFIVVPECGAIEVMAIFLAAILAFPAGTRKKLLGLAIGLPLMYIINIVRLTCLGVIGALTGGGEWFDFAHNYVWQAIYVVFVVAVWLAWVEYIVRKRRTWKTPHAAAA